MLPLVGTAIWLFAFTPSDQAAVFNIAAGDVPGLKAAVTASNTNGEDDTIVLASNATYQFTAANGGLGNAGLPSIAPDGGHKLTIVGSGALFLRSFANGTPNFRFLHIQSGADVTIQGFIDFNNGNAGNAQGGGIFVDGETAAVSLTVLGCHFGGCKGTYGGAIFIDAYNDPSFPAHNATLIVHDTGFSGNSASQYGGAIWDDSGGYVMELRACSFSSNTAVRSAGAVQFDGSNGTAVGTVANCRFSQNSAGDFSGALGVDGRSGSATLGVAGCTFDSNTATNGGAMDIDGTSGNANVTVVNCTLSANGASTGGGIELDGGSGGSSVLKVASCTFTGGSAGPGSGADLYVKGIGAGTTDLQIGNTILNSGITGNNLVNEPVGTGTVTSQGFNLSSDDAGGGAGMGPGGLLNHAGDIRNTDPLLDPAGLKNNDTAGLTPTIALQATSPAIDHGNSGAGAPAPVDQRGEQRPFDDLNTADGTGSDGSDIGAYEADVRIVSHMRSGSNLVFQFLSILGRTYEVENRSALTSGTWSTVTTTTPPPPITGTGGVVIVTVPNAVGGGGGPGFYRVSQVP